MTEDSRSKPETPSTDDARLTEAASPPNPVDEEHEKYLKTVNDPQEDRVADTNLASSRWDLAQKIYDPWSDMPVPQMRDENESAGAYGNAHFVSLDTLPLGDASDSTGRIRPTAAVLSADIDTPTVGRPTDGQRSPSGPPWVIAGTDPRMHGIQDWVGQVQEMDYPFQSHAYQSVYHYSTWVRGGDYDDTDGFDLVAVAPYFNDDSFGALLWCSVGMYHFPQPGEWVFVRRILGRRATDQRHRDIVTSYAPNMSPFTPV